MKVIGLVPLYDDEKESLWMLPGYMKVVEACSGLPIMFPLTTNEEELSQCYSMCDGILMTGGHDVDPALYHAQRTERCGVSCTARDAMETYLFHRAVRENKPVLGICRGIQLMNVLMGGTLYQDLPTEHPSPTKHHMTPPYDTTIHQVEVLPDTLLADLIGTGQHSVNSYHHQAISELGPGLAPMAISEDGLIEAVSVPDKTFIVGVQWHPEFIFEKDDECLKLVQAFVDACKS